MTFSCSQPPTITVDIKASLRMSPVFSKETQFQLLQKETKQTAEAAVFPQASPGTLNLRHRGKKVNNFIWLQID